MPLPSSGIIVVEKPSSASITRISNSSTSINTIHSSIHPPQDQKEQQTQIQYYEYYDVHETQPQQQYHQQQQQQQHSTIVVDATLFHHQQQKQQQHQLGGSSVVAIGRKIHSSSSTSSSSSSTSSSSLCSTSSTLLNKSNLQIQTLKTVPMPQNKQYSQQQQIIQHTSHSSSTTATTSNPQHHIHQSPQHVQQINLAASSIHHHSQQQQSQPPHVIQVSEEFLEQAASNHNAGNMMISTTGEVINQQQIFKIVSTDGATGNMIIDASNQSSNATTTNSKVLLSNLTVLSKQQASSQGHLITNNHQQSQTPGQTINFVNAKNVYTTSTAGGKQQKFTVANANVTSYKGSTIKQTSSANNQYLQQSNSVGQQKINITAGNRNMQMLTTTRVQNASNSNSSSNVTSNNSIALISNNAASAQTMVLQQPQKFIANNTSGSKMTTATLGSGGGNVIKKSGAAGTLRMNNSHNTATATKLMNNIQTTQGVKTFITQNSSVQQQTQQNINQLTLQHHATKAGSKSKFVKQYNNAILNSAGAVAIATLPHQHSNNQNNLQIQQHQQLQQQTTYVSHHKSSGGSTKINKINSKYAQSVNMAAHLPAGTQLHQKSINQSQQQQQQFQTPTSNSNIKFVNAQGTVIQQQQQPQQHQQSLATQKANNKHHHHHQQQYQNLQNFDTVDGNHIFNQANANQPAAAMSSSISSGTTALPLTAATSSSLLTDDIMMVNGTQMTDELSARILQSMSQKSFGNQRYQQQQQHVFQTKTSATPVSSSINSNSNNNNNNYNSNNNNMLPPPSCSTQNTIVQANNSNILLSPREYTLYPTTSSASTVGIMPANQQSHHQLQQSSPIHYNNSATPTSSTSSNITPGSFSSNNYITISSNSNSMTTITPHTSGISAANGVLCTNTIAGSTNTVRQVQSAPGSRSQSMERKLHESSMSRKSTEYYKVKIKDYHTGCAFVVPSTATIYATNPSASVTSLIDFIIPLPSCTTITTTNNITTSSTNCATMTTILTNSSYNQNLAQQFNNNSNHNSLRGSSHHNNLTATASVAQTSGSLGMATGNISASVSNLMGSIVPTTSTISSPLPISRPPSLPPAPIILEPQTQVIHLQATKTLPGANNSSNDDDNDIIGEEIRPSPVETEDIRLRILHAVLLDHTYVNAMPLELPTSFAVNLPPASISISLAAPAGATTGIANGQQWSLGGIGAISTAGSGGAAQQNFNVYGNQLSRLHEENDSYSALSNNSGLAIGDIDPGEETETAPEAELEDDSVTRCICDLTHDDGYMICCDKCCAWQHVDCMGIDRQNIPDEYLCELCQPRIVDKARARSLQLMKRKEQQQQLMLTAQAQISTSGGTMAAAGSASGGSMGGVSNLLPNDVLGAQQRLTSSSGTLFSLTGNMAADSSALQLLTSGGSNLKKSKILKKTKDGLTGKRSKKAEKLAAAAAGLNTSGKPLRKETKKNTKRKKAGAHDGSSSTVGMTAAEKHAANLRQWIENYELAVTNHYSPELRARLHAISKQPSLLQCILNTENPILKEFSTGSLENRATTVPHAGGKILISNLNIGPHSPICELRGKYMLTTQYKTQNTSMNMNSPPPNNYHLASYKAHKTPGPFIFFYQLPSTEVTPSYQQHPQTTSTAILNPDGTYTTSIASIPALQSPPTFLKGPEICVDTRTYGNEARFVRRSCRPNAEIQHLFEKGTIHLFIVALTDIRASTEITIRHEPHDLLAVDNKKSSSIVIQSTSTPCACGLTKDCIFGPPIPQLPPAAKSNAGRKSLAHGGGLSGTTGNLTAKQRKANQQNLNRNRSISSSASGDSNMGVTSTANSVSMSLNSPNAVSRMAGTNKMIANSNILMPLTASCNSNLSNASSASSNLTSVMHDSGVCTSSSSPSVSIPSPTQNMHSPIQQQHQALQQQAPHHFLQNTHIRSSVQLLPQQQMTQSLPTPLVLTSPNVSHQQPQQQNQQEQFPVLQQPPMVIPQQPQQSLNVIAQAATVVNSAQDVNDPTEQNRPQTSVSPTSQEVKEDTSPTQHQQPTLHQQLVLHEQEQQQIVTPPTTKPSDPPAATESPVMLETVSPEATIAAVALQALNASHSPNSSIATTSSSCPMLETQNHLQPPPIQQQQQFLIVPANEVIGEEIQQPKAPQSQTSEKNITSTSVTSTTSLTLSPHQSQQQSPLQQHKSPQKANQSQNNSPHPVRKTPAKHGRTTSFSEENEQHQHNDDNSVTSTPTYSSTPKEKPKLSREDRKMEAILRAIEKMERNQQKQKQSKRQNASSQNTTPTSPNKTFDSHDNSGGSKRGNSHTGAVGRSKKKRKAAAKGGQGGGYNQRKRRQSRMNSQESVEDCNQQDQDTITSESDGCAPMHSPPIQTMASLRQPSFSTPTSSSVASGVITTSKLTSETSNNVDQAAGLLMSFANPNISSINSSSGNEINEQHLPQSPHRLSSQYMMPSIGAQESSPPTPPSQVSSACLLIEAAVGPLESNLDGNNEEIHNVEFKYPLQAKTKKHLMNNWLHQTEDSSSDNNTSTLSEQTSQTLQATPTTSLDCGGSDVAGVSVASSGGLDSLLQAAMSDLTQSQNNTEQPQNLSIAAQKVEEFIQQTEASACSPQIHPQTKHSYEYSQHQQPERTYINLPTPAVDLTLKTPLTIGQDLSSEMCSSNNRNFHLPLQVSTCSNNSSVKKRWLRQAISEETHEEFQHTFPMTSSPTKAVSINTLVNSQVQPIATCSSATMANYVPNGFSTPLKKRRLLLTGKDEVDESIANSCTDLFANSNPPPVTDLPTQQHTTRKNETISQEFENKEMPQDLSYRDTHEDLDVDVEKCETNEKHLNCTQGVVGLEHRLQQDLQFSKIEADQEADVDVTTSPQEDIEVLKDQSRKVVVKHENSVACDEVKQEYLNTSVQHTVQAGPVEFNDQDDDVDILRSPSPGREMIKAEDNLVKIEPEDISGMEDVKIDVEREESMAADDDVVTQHKEKKEDPLPDAYKIDQENNETSFSNNVEIKKEFKTESAKETQARQMEDYTVNVESVKSKAEGNEDLQIKSEEESQEPKSKRIKLENHEGEEEKLDPFKTESATEKAFNGDDINVKPVISTATKVNQKLENAPHSIGKVDEKCVLQTETVREVKDLATNAIAELKSSTLLNTDSTFDDIETVTPPPTLTTTLPSGNEAPIQRQKSLSDDDIQARLHSFHKENILFLQSRNKKTKSSSSLTSNVTSNAPSTNCYSNSKIRTSSSSSSSTNHQHHHNHHNHYNYHESKEKSDKSALKHRKNSSSTPSGSNKKQKLHKRERTTSSSSSNSHKNSTNPQITSSSSISNKNVVATSNSNSTSSGSPKNSKKLKSLKKTSYGSSTSSLNTYSSSTLAIQNCYSISSSTTATATSYHSEKEKSVDKDKNHRQRTTSASSNNVSSSTLSITPTGSYPSSKKRQLNFELELTKDLHLLNSTITGSGKHKREISRLLSDEQPHVAVKRSRKESTVSQKEDLKNSTNKHTKVEKQDKKNSGVATGIISKQSAGFNNSAASQPTTTPATNATTTTTPIYTPAEEPKLIPTIVSQPPHSALTPIPILREHPTIPHFNNVIVGASSSSLASQQQQLQPNLTPVQSQAHPPVLLQNIPNHMNSPSFVPSTHINHNPQLQQPPLPSTSPTTVCVTSPLSAQNVNSASHLPFYNTIYGKLLDNNTPPPSLPTPLLPSNTTTPSSPITSTSVQTGGSGVLLEYLDTKLKSYNTLGGYVSHSALFGLNNTPIVKDSLMSTAVVSSSTIAIGSVGTHAKDPATEMPAPHAPPSTVCSSSTTTSGSNTSAASLTSMKIHTKTASHDPRLNPQLTAPEPPPQPKRKLSINEYRKRMQQTSSNDSNSGSGSLTTTPTSPPTPLDPSSFSSLLGPITPLTNKCTLNSPDRLTQSVDSQIQKEIMSTNSAATSSSSLDSLNSSNSSTSLNDTLLKSSSFVEEDSTKGQFNAAPTLLEKQQESLCARLKSLKEKQSLGTSFGVGSGDRSRFSSFSESVASGDFGLRKDDEEIEILRNRNLSISSSIGGGDLLDNCLEEISSTSTSMSSSREPSPDRCYTSGHQKILTASATTTMANTSAASHSNNGQTTTRHHHQQHNINFDKKSELTGRERKKSVDIA